MYTFEEEKILIQKASKGDEDSFEALITSCKPKAYSLAFRYLKNEEDAMDALQESFIRIFRHLGKFNCESRFDTWVYRIVTNICCDIMRKNKSHLEFSTTLTTEEAESFELETPDPAPGPEGLYLKKEEVEFLHECMNMLSPEHREIIMLRDLQEFSYEEIAGILNCSMGTVKSRISRARQALKDIYINKK